MTEDKQRRMRKRLSQFRKLPPERQRLIRWLVEELNGMERADRDRLRKMSKEDRRTVLRRMLERAQLRLRKDPRGEMRGPRRGGAARQMSPEMRGRMQERLRQLPPGQRKEAERRMREFHRRTPGRPPSDEQGYPGAGPNRPKWPAAPGDRQDRSRRGSQGTFGRRRRERPTSRPASRPAGKRKRGGEARPRSQNPPDAIPEPDRAPI